MPSWREFQADRRVRSRAFFARHGRLRFLRVLLVLLIFVPVIATFLLLDYGDAFGLSMGAARYRAAVGVVLLAGVTMLAIVAVLAVARWKEEARLTEAFVAVGFAALPVAWAAVASCVLDLKADAPTCTSGAVDLAFASMTWMLAWTIAGPLADFLRQRRLR